MPMMLPLKQSRESRILSEDPCATGRRQILPMLRLMILSILGRPGDKPHVPQSNNSNSSDTVASSTTLIPSDTSTLPPSNGIHIRQSSSASILWQHIDKQSLHSILATREGFEMATKLKGSDATSIVDLLDNILDSENLTDFQENRCLTLQQNLCENCGIVPSSCTIMEGLEQVSNFPKAGGKFSDVLEGTLRGQNVAIKVLRMHTVEEPIKLKKRFCGQAVIWKRLSHPNVLRFIGTANSSSQLSHISPWMENGNITSYTKKNPRANRLHLLKNVTDGLFYLHSKDIVHGDLRGANILIRDDNQACLADFVLTTMFSDMGSCHAVNEFRRGPLRWMAPELLIPKEFGLDTCAPIKESDMYSFGMVIYEVVSGNAPFGHFRQTEAVGKIIAGIRPTRPTDPAIIELVNKVWPLAERCWSRQRNERLTIRQVLDRFPSS